MVSELFEIERNSSMASSPSTTTILETELSLQTLHQCKSLISLKLDNSNYLLWRSQMESLIQSINMGHHLVESKEPSREVIKENGKTEINEAHLTWAKNDGLLKVWMLSNISPEVIVSLENISSASKIWKSVEELILPTTVEREILLHDALMSLKKGNLPLDEYLKKFKSICDNLAAIKRPVDETKIFFSNSQGTWSKIPRFSNSHVI